MPGISELKNLSYPLRYDEEVNIFEESFRPHAYMAPCAPRYQDNLAMLAEVAVASTAVQEPTKTFYSCFDRLSISNDSTITDPCLPPRKTLRRY